MISDFFGNRRVVESLEQMVKQDRLPQTLLFAGPEGIGKATLARRLAAQILGEREKIEQDDLSLPANRALIEDREKWTSDRRAEEPLYLASHPDFLTFPPDGPLRQISIQQVRLLKQQAQFKPLHGSRRVFLIDRLDRANEQAANSAPKVLEEPPPHLVLVATVENAQDVLPTIRSRSVILYLTPLATGEMKEFVRARKLDHPERRVRLAGGCPGRAVSLNLEEHDRRVAAMVGLLRAACGAAPFSAWLQHSELVALAREDKLDAYLATLYELLEDLLAIQKDSGEIRNLEVVKDLQKIASYTSFEWVRAAVRKVDEVVSLLRRNIQKSIALDALVLSLQRK